MRMRGKAVASYFAYRLGIRKAFSSVTEDELSALKRCAQGKKVLVELGVYEGKTSLAFREVMHPNGTLWLVDPFVPGVLGVSWQRLIAQSEVGRSANGTVRFLRTLSGDAAETWSESFDFLFIDADHTYESVRRDWESWASFAKPGAHIAFHDSCLKAARCKPTDGPVRLVNEIVANNCDFCLVEQVDSLTVFQRQV
jgi:predicted O-methyltransferase YrrM